MDEQKPKVQVIPANPFKRYKKEDDVYNGGVGIYCRVSTTEQKQLNSLSNQVSGLLILAPHAPITRNNAAIAITHFKKLTISLEMVMLFLVWKVILAA